MEGGLAMQTPSLDQLGDEIAELSPHLAAATARLLDLIPEFDIRAGWNTGFRSCAAWLSWRVGFAPGAAREHVRVARALGTLPLLSQALARGELSYAKVREVTRVATPETEERLLGRLLEVGARTRTIPPALRRALHHEVTGDPVTALRARNDAEGLVLHGRTATPGWLGERLDVGWAIDVLHPLAR
jgi:hypothetical protein